MRRREQRASARRAPALRCNALHATPLLSSSRISSGVVGTMTALYSAAVMEPLRVGQGSRLILPGALFDLDHDPRTLVEAEMIRWRHVEDAMRAMDFSKRLECVAQRGAKLGRTRLRLLQ